MIPVIAMTVAVAVAVFVSVMALAETVLRIIDGWDRVDSE